MPKNPRKPQAPKQTPKARKQQKPADAPLTVEAAERILGARLPDAYRRFVQSGEHLRWRDASLTYRSSCTFELDGIRFDSTRDLEWICAGGPFEHNGFTDHPERLASYLYDGDQLAHCPIAKLSSSRRGLSFLAIDVRDPGACPVRYFEMEGHDTERWELVAHDFEEFVQLLVPEGAVDPVQDLEERYERAAAKHKKKSYAGALAILDPLLADFGALAPIRQEIAGELAGEAFNLRGLCRRELEDETGAQADFRLAAARGHKEAGLSAAAHCLAHRDPRTALAALEHVHCRGDTFDLRFYEGQAHVMLGNEKEASEAFRYLQREFWRGAPERLSRARPALEAIGGPLAAAVLTWFGVERSAAGLSRAEVAANRAWWESLPATFRERLGQDRVREGEPASDDAILAILDNADWLSCDCEGIGVADVSALLRLGALRSLSLRHAPGLSLDGLSAFTRVIRLALSDGELTDIAPLARLTWLEKLVLRNNSIADASPLAPLVRLRELDLGHNSLSDLSPLAGLAELETLEITRNPCADLKVIAKLPRLKRLDASKTRVVDLSPLAGHPSIETLDLGDDGLTDLSPLASCPKLKELDVDGVDEGVVRAFKKLRRDVEVDG